MFPITRTLGITKTGSCRLRGFSVAKPQCKEIKWFNSHPLQLKPSIINICFCIYIGSDWLQLSVFLKIELHRVLGPEQSVMTLNFLTKSHLQAKDVLLNINHTQAAERAEKCRFLSVVTLTVTLVRARDQTCLLYEFGTNLFCSSGDNSYTNKKTTDCRCQNRTFRSSPCAVINIKITNKNHKYSNN